LGDLLRKHLDIKATGGKKFQKIRKRLVILENLEASDF